jgi:hypothetical protein
MKIPEWIQTALYGAVAGAIALAIVGFGWGGWVTGGTADEMAFNAGSAAAVAAMTPYCLAQTKSDPNATRVLAALKAANSYDRSRILAKAGWATPPGAREPIGDLARACTSALSLD